MFNLRRNSLENQVRQLKSKYLFNQLMCSVLETYYNTFFLDENAEQKKQTTKYQVLTD